VAQCRGNPEIRATPLGGAEAGLRGFLTRRVRDSDIIPAMCKEPKPSPTESPLLFEIDPQPIEETRRALGGIPLVVQAGSG